MQAAIEDFLQTWLVQGNPAAAMTYISDTAYACVLDLEPDSLTTAMAPYRLLRDMECAIELLGRPRRLEGVVVGSGDFDARLAHVPHEFSELFSIVRVPGDAADLFFCWRPGVHLYHFEPGHGREFYGVAFRLVGTHGESAEIFQLWTNEAQYWKLFSFHIDHPEVVAPTLARLDAVEVSRERASVRRAGVNPELAAAVDGFLTTWLVERDTKGALRHVSPAAYECNHLFIEESAVPAAEDEAARLLRDGLEVIASAIGEVTSLDAAIAAVEPWHPDVHWVKHPHEHAYTLIGLPDDLAEAHHCHRRLAGSHAPSEAEGAHGNHYSLAFKLRLPGLHPPVFQLVRGREAGAWQVIAYDVTVH